MHLSVTGVIFSRIINEILEEGECKAYPLGGRNEAVAIFGAMKPSGPDWHAYGEDARVHIDQLPVDHREGKVGQHTVRVGSRNDMNNYLAAKEIR